jgi:hypothetical protein
MNRIFDIFEEAQIDPRNTYIRSYPALIEHFRESHQKLSPATLTVLMHTVYAWMPTTLHIHADDETLRQACWILHQAKYRILDLKELATLASCTNNSMVGASKLLHFHNPGLFPIWDSKVYRFMNKGGSEEAPHAYRVNNCRRYLEYQVQVLEATMDERTTRLVRHVSALCGYRVTPVRAIEMVMFLISNQRDAIVVDGEPANHVSPY